MTGREIFAAAVGVVVGGGAVALGLLLDLTNAGWTLVAATTGAIATLGALGFAYVQIQHAKKRSRIDRTFDLINLILGQESLRARIIASQILDDLDPTPVALRFATFQDLKSKSPDDRFRRGQVYFLLNIIERMAFGYKHHLLDRPLTRMTFEKILTTELNNWRWMIEKRQNEERLLGTPEDLLPYCDMIWLSGQWGKDKGGKA